MVKRWLMLLLIAVLPFVGLTVRVLGNDISAKAYIVTEASFGQVLAAKNAQEKLPMASTTKIMTAYLTLQQENPYEEFTIDPCSVRVEGSAMGLMEGDVVSLYALACGMLLASGNDAANAAAIRIGGSVEEFAALMNEQAAKLGMKDTHFVNPSGLPDEEHYSTAADMAILTAAALRLPLFREICGSTEKEVSVSGEMRRYRNHNRLLSAYDGCIGVKTGYTKKAGRCLVSAAERGDATLICVTLSAPDDWNDHKKLLDNGFASVRQTTLSPDTADWELSVVGGVTDTIPAAVLGEAKVFLSEEQAKEISQEIRLRSFYYAPVYAGTRLGEVRYRYQGKVIAVLPIFAKEDVAYRDNGLQ